MTADKALPFHTEAVGKQKGGNADNGKKYEKYDNMNISDPPITERKPGNHPDGDKVDAYDEYGKRTIEKLVGELDRYIQGSSTEDRPENEDIGDKKRPKAEDIQAGIDAFE